MRNKIEHSRLALKLGFASIFVGAFFTISCSAFWPQQTEEQALQSLRQLMKDDKLPPESMVQQIETKFAGTKAGALAKLLRAQIRMTNGDPSTAAEILNSDIFRRKTVVADYALWLRGKALLASGRYAEAMNALDQLVREFPDSVRVREGRLLWAQSALPGGQPQKVPEYLTALIAKNDPDALILAAKSFEQVGNQNEAVSFYRKTYFYGAGTQAARDAESKLTQFSQPLTPANAEEATIRADRLHQSGNHTEAVKAYDTLLSSYPVGATPPVHLKRIVSYGSLKRGADAQSAFNAIPASANEKVTGYRNLVEALAKSRLWPQARQTAEEMRRLHPGSELTAKTWIAAGMIAKDAKNKVEESYYLRTAVAAYPNAVDVAKAQFELAWLEHDSRNYTRSSQMLVEHLAKYADKDTTYRGRAGYWAARDSELAGRFPDACYLYDSLIYRYNSNWYGYLASQRLASMRAMNRCDAKATVKDTLVLKAGANLKTITVAPETSTPKEQALFVKAEQLSAVGLYSWATDELNFAATTAANSPKVNLAVAKLYRLRDDNTSALRALARSYPDYSQMFPEEMGREEWDIFYPLHSWDHIKLWAKNRNLDQYQVAGLIRQESVFNPRARSHADAFGLMQLLLPTARSVARKYGSAATISIEALYQPALNIELGTGYMRDMFDKFGRIEFVACGYNAGPGRVPQWRSSLPAEMDEFVEAIPFAETRAYVQGVIRNSAQYRRLYDESGNFKPNIGTKPVRGIIDSQTRERIAQELPDVIVDERVAGSSD